MSNVQSRGAHRRSLLMPWLCGLLLAAVAGAASAMPIFVSWNGHPTMTLEVESSDTIENVKQKIHDTSGLDVALLILHYAGIELEDGRTLADYNIQKNATLELTVVVAAPAVPVPSTDPRSLLALALLLGTTGVFMAARRGRERRRAA